MHCGVSRGGSESKGAQRGATWLVRVSPGLPTSPTSHENLFITEIKEDNTSREGRLSSYIGCKLCQC